jgi:hypothetical protein
MKSGADVESAPDFIRATVWISCFAVGVFSMRWPLFRGWQKAIEAA